MNADQFWDIIESARRDGPGQEGMVTLITAKLTALGPDEMVSYQSIFDELMNRAYRWDLWGAAFIIRGGCSDDSFEYFRAWLIGKGRAVYEAALRDPESLASVVDPEAINDLGEYLDFEELLYVAWTLYEDITGKEMPRPKLAIYSESASSSEPDGEPWSEDGDDLERRFPRLWKKFAEADE